MVPAGELFIQKKMLDYFCMGDVPCVAASGQWQIEGANMLFNTVIRGTHATVTKVEAFFQLYPSLLCLLNCCTGEYPEVSHYHRSLTEVADI